MEKTMSQGKFQQFVIAQFTHMGEEMSAMKTELRTGLAEVRQDISEIKAILTPVT